MEPLSNGHFGTDINSRGVSSPLYRGCRFQFHYIDRGDKIWGFSFVHCGEVFNTVSLSRRVLFERFHCSHILFVSVYYNFGMLTNEKQSCKVENFSKILNTAWLLLA